MTLVERLAKPAYLYRPQQLVQRVRIRGQARPIVRLPWGLALEVVATEHLGRGIARSGVHELPVTEVISRLVSSGDLCIDAGANIGYFTSLMASRVGGAGRVLAFEPQPTVRELLERNVKRWHHPAIITVDPRALSNVAGTAHLTMPADFAERMATASIGPEGLEVETVTLDDALGDRPAALLKLDIEGHEFQALEGAQRALAERRVAHIVFEEHEPLPTPVSQRLIELGYVVFAARETFRGVSLSDARDDSAHSKWMAPTYLATLDQELVTRRIRPDGWHCLRWKTNS